MAEHGAITGAWLSFLDIYGQGWRGWGSCRTVAPARKLPGVNTRGRMKGSGPPSRGHRHPCGGTVVSLVDRTQTRLCSLVGELLVAALLSTKVKPTRKWLL